MTTTTYLVTGLTCEHCAQAVTQELGGLDGVRSVTVSLAAGGVSAVSVVSVGPLALTQVELALDEAGDYRLAGTDG